MVNTRDQIYLTATKIIKKFSIFQHLGRKQIKFLLLKNICLMLTF